MDTNRPITDYEVECKKNEIFANITVGDKYTILADPKNGNWLIRDNAGERRFFDKNWFGTPTLRPECANTTHCPNEDVPIPAPTVTPNPDIELLDKFAMAALTGFCSFFNAEQMTGNEVDYCVSISYLVANRMLNERKKYLTLNTDNNG